MKQTHVISTQVRDEPQRQLWADLVPIQSPPKVYRKAVAAIHSYAINGPYNLYTRRVANALAVLAVGHWQLLTSDEQLEILEKRITLKFRGTVGDIRRCMNIDPKDQNYGRIHAALKALYQLEFRFDVMADLEGDPAWTVHSRLISQYSKAKDGSGRVEWEYPPDVFQMLIQPNRFATLNMVQVNSFQTAHGLALFENTVRYLNNPAHLTSRKSVTDWVLLLSNKPDLYLKEYRYFKRDVLQPAIEELETNPLCPISVTFLETKGARGKVTHLQFRVELKKQRPVLVGVGPGSPNPMVLAQLRALGLASDTITRLLVSMEDNEILECLERLRSRIARLPPVKNAAGLFLSYCNEKVRPAADLEPPSGLETAETPIPTQNESASFEEEQQRREEVEAEFYALAPSEQGSLLSTFRSTLSNDSLVALKLDSVGLADSLARRLFFIWLRNTGGRAG